MHFDGQKMGKLQAICRAESKRHVKAAKEAEDEDDENDKRNDIGAVEPKP